jgi:phosphate transport system substrate-binding protein
MHLTIVGSDTLATLNTQWASSFRVLQPAVSIDVQASGSATAPPALAAGSAAIGAMSRRMTDSEFALFSRDSSLALTEVIIGYDAISILVHVDNALTEISLAQLERIFSDTRHCASGGPIRLWSDLISSDILGNRSITPFGRPASSGTYGFFRHVVLCGGNPVPWVNELAGSAAIVQAIAQEVTALGYVGGDIQHSGVRQLGLKMGLGHAVGPTDIDYPLRRPLYLYFTRLRGEQLTSITCEFAQFVLGDRGQELVSRAGFFPLEPLGAQEVSRRVCDG